MTGKDSVERTVPHLNCSASGQALVCARLNRARAPPPAAVRAQAFASRAVDFDEITRAQRTLGRIVSGNPVPIRSTLDRVHNMADGLLLTVVVLSLVGSVHAWVTVSPQGRVTIKAETQIGYATIVLALVARRSDAQHADQLSDTCAVLLRHWELPEEVDPRKSLFVTGDINVGRDPSNVNVWGNMTLTGIVDLTAGADPDEAILVRSTTMNKLVLVACVLTTDAATDAGVKLKRKVYVSQRRGAKVHLDGADFVNGTLVNASQANVTQADGLRRLSDDSMTVTLRRLEESAFIGDNTSCVQSQVSLQNG